MNDSGLIATSGSLAYDFISHFPRPFSEVLLPDHLAKLSVCFVVDRKERFFGGTAGNIAYNFSLLKKPVRVFAAVGHDFDDYRAHLQKAGVDLSPLRPSPEVATASATIITDSLGNQISEFFPGAMGNGLKPHTGPLQEASLFIISPDNPLWMIEYASLARTLKVPYFFDPGQALPSFSSEQMREALHGAGGLFVNEYELKLLEGLLGLSRDEIAALVPLMVVTLGERGSLVITATERFEIPAVRVEQALDPTGCGDAYRAGFLTAFQRGDSPEVCGQWGSVLGSFCVERAGTQNHSPSLREMEKRYRESFEASE